jgi:thiamine-phosphate pyrophosphorylase
MLARFYPIVDTAAAARHGCATTMLAECLLEAGVKLLQFRHKEHFSDLVVDELRTIAKMCRMAGALLIVDDRPDLARMVGAAGVHVGQDDLTPDEARRVMGSGLIGHSTHNREQLTKGVASGADYLALGPLFATASKGNPDPVVGLEALRELAPLVSQPLVVIGGITRANAGLALEAGAASVAVIADLYPDEHNRAALRERAREWLDATVAG